MAAKRRREEAAAQWVAPAPLETIDASGTSNEMKTASAVIRRSNVTAVPLEHIINSRRSFGNFNKATEDNHKFLQRQLNTHQREEEAEKDAVGDEEMAAFFQRSTSKSGRQRGERTGSGSGGILGKRGSRSSQFEKKEEVGDLGTMRCVECGDVVLSHSHVNKYQNIDLLFFRMKHAASFCAFSIMYA